MTVVERIIQLVDRRVGLRFDKDRPKACAEITTISAKLAEIKQSCPTSWQAAGRILHPTRTA